MKGYKTIIFNILAAILPILEASGADLGLEGQGLAYYALGITIANVILRFYTTTPVGGGNPADAPAETRDKAEQ